MISLSKKKLGIARMVKKKSKKRNKKDNDCGMNCDPFSEIENSTLSKISFSASSNITRDARDEIKKRRNSRRKYMKKYSRRNNMSELNSASYPGRSDDNYETSEYNFEEFCIKDGKSVNKNKEKSSVQKIGGVDKYSNPKGDIEATNDLELSKHIESENLKIHIGETDNEHDPLKLQEERYNLKFMYLEEQNRKDENSSNLVLTNNQIKRIEHTNTEKQQVITTHLGSFESKQETMVNLELSNLNNTSTVNDNSVHEEILNTLNIEQIYINKVIEQEHDLENVNTSNYNELHDTGLKYLRLSTLNYIDDTQELIDEDLEFKNENNEVKQLEKSNLENSSEVNAKKAKPQINKETLDKLILDKHGINKLETPEPSVISDRDIIPEINLENINPTNQHGIDYSESLVHNTMTQRQINKEETVTNEENFENLLLTLAESNAMREQIQTDLYDLEHPMSSRTFNNSNPEKPNENTQLISDYRDKLKQTRNSKNQKLTFTSEKNMQDMNFENQNLPVEKSKETQSDTSNLKNVLYLDIEDPFLSKNSEDSNLAYINEVVVMEELNKMENISLGGCCGIDFKLKTQNGNKETFLENESIPLKEPNTSKMNDFIKINYKDIQQEIKEENSGLLMNIDSCLQEINLGNSVKNESCLQKINIESSGLSRNNFNCSQVTNIENSELSMNDHFLKYKSLFNENRSNKTPDSRNLVENSGCRNNERDENMEPYLVEEPILCSNDENIKQENMHCTNFNYIYGIGSLVFDSKKIIINNDETVCHKESLDLENPDLPLLNRMEIGKNNMMENSQLIPLKERPSIRPLKLTLPTITDNENNSFGENVYQGGSETENQFSSDRNAQQENIKTDIKHSYKSYDSKELDILEPINRGTSQKGMVEEVHPLTEEKTKSNEKSVIEKINNEKYILLKTNNENTLQINNNFNVALIKEGGDATNKRESQCEEKDKRKDNSPKGMNESTQNKLKKLKCSTLQNKASRTKKGKELNKRSRCTIS